MAAASNHPWNVYAQQLFPQGYGYPLWLPEPDPAAREVALGDVGWVDNGSFLQLFNSRLEHEEDQVRNDVPNEFVPFNPPNLIIKGPTKSIAIPPLCSHTVKTVEASGSGQATVYVSSSENPMQAKLTYIQWTCSNDNCQRELLLHMQ